MWSSLYPARREQTPCLLTPVYLLHVTFSGVLFSGGRLAALLKLVLLHAAGVKGEEHTETEVNLPPCPLLLFHLIFDVERNIYLANHSQNHCYFIYC